MRQSHERYQSGRFLLERFGAERFLDPYLMAILWQLRQTLVDEYAAPVPTPTATMLIDLAMMTYYNALRMQGWIGNLGLQIEHECFDQEGPTATLRKHRSVVEGLAVEDTLRRLAGHASPPDATLERSRRGCTPAEPVRLTGYPPCGLELRVVVIAEETWGSNRRRQYGVSPRFYATVPLSFRVARFVPETTLHRPSQGAVSRPERVSPGRGQRARAVCPPRSDRPCPALLRILCRERPTRSCLFFCINQCRRSLHGGKRPASNRRYPALFCLRRCLPLVPGLGRVLVLPCAPQPDAMVVLRACVPLFPPPHAPAGRDRRPACRGARSGVYDGSGAIGNGKSHWQRV